MVHQNMSAVLTVLLALFASIFFANPVASAPSKNKDRVYVGLYHRDGLSLGSNRQHLGLQAYHWAILTTPKQSAGPGTFAYDVTNGALVDPNTRTDLNPHRLWRFQAKAVDPRRSDRLLGRIMIGKADPKTATQGQITALLHHIPVPEHGDGEESCVTWTHDAITELQRYGLAESFDVEEFMEHALAYADQQIRYPGENMVINYTDRPLKRDVL